MLRNLFGFRSQFSAVVMVVCLSGALAVAQEGKESEAPGESIFNGVDLTGWEGNTSLWTVKDGAITGTTTAEDPLKFNTFLVYRGGDVANFELNLEYKIVAGNSGIQYRSKVMDEEKFIVGGYQADIDSTPRYSGIMYEEKGRGILCERGQVTRVNKDGSKQVIGSLGDRDALQSMIKSEDWNKYKIVANGNRLQHFINGTLMSETVDNQPEKGATSGVLALQIHQGPPMVVQFRNLKLKTLEEKPKAE